MSTVVPFVRMFLEPRRVLTIGYRPSTTTATSIHPHRLYYAIRRLSSYPRRGSLRGCPRSESNVPRRKSARGVKPMERKTTFSSTAHLPLSSLHPPPMTLTLPPNATTRTSFGTKTRNRRGRPPISRNTPPPCTTSPACRLGLCFLWTFRDARGGVFYRIINNTAIFLSLS